MSFSPISNATSQSRRLEDLFAWAQVPGYELLSCLTAGSRAAVRCVREKQADGNKAQRYVPSLRVNGMRFRLLAIGLALPAVGHAQYVIGTRDSLSSRVDMVFRAFDRVDSPGCAVGVYRYGRVLYARGYGMANLELGVPNTPRTVFDVGSISKEFTATAILLLAQEGKLSLNDDVRRYFPEMPAYVETVKRNLTARWPAATVVVFGHLGDGNLHVIAGVGDRNARHAIEETVYAPLEAIGGSISAEHGIGLQKREFLGVSRSPVEVELMRTLKRALDPKNVLNPGKILG